MKFKKKDVRITTYNSDILTGFPPTPYITRLHHRPTGLCVEVYGAYDLVEHTREAMAKLKGMVKNET